MRGSGWKKKRIFSNIIGIALELRIFIYTTPDALMEKGDLLATVLGRIFRSVDQRRQLFQIHFSPFRAKKAFFSACHLRRLRREARKTWVSFFKIIFLFNEFLRIGQVSSSSLAVKALGSFRVHNMILCREHVTSGQKPYVDTQHRHLTERFQTTKYAALFFFSARFIRRKKRRRKFVI